MNVGCGDRNGKGNTFFAARVSDFNAIVMENTVIDTFAGSTGFHLKFPLVRTARNVSEQAQIPRGVNINGTPVR